MKNIKFLNLVIATSMLILTACNNESKEEADEKKDSVTTALKKDTGS